MGLVPKELTARQGETLRLIRKSILERGYPPTLRELGDWMGIRSTNGVNDHLLALQAKGFLTRDPMFSRGIVLKPKDDSCPLCGTPKMRIVAGEVT